MVKARNLYLLIACCVMGLGIYVGFFMDFNPSARAYRQSVAGQDMTTIHVADHGWHAGIIIPNAALPKQYLPERASFGQKKYIEIGWGDSGFYQANQITIPLALRALFWPTSSVVHLVAFNEAPDAYFTTSDIIALNIPTQNLENFAAFIDTAIDRNGAERAMARGKGLYGTSLFFTGTGSYHIAHTCNHFSAEALKIAGIPLTTYRAATSANLMSQIARYGTWVRKGQKKSVWELVQEVF